MLGIREPRMPTDHRMVLRVLIGEGVRRHRRYNKERTTWPITEAKGGKRQEGGSQFMDLKRRVRDKSMEERTTSASCISDTT